MKEGLRIELRKAPMKLSVIMPVYNERKTLLEILQRVQKVDIEKEIIIIDDFSTDGTREILKESAIAQAGKEIKVVFQDKNRGKGAAIRKGLEYAEGDYVIVQDGDLEYNPEDYHKLFQPILEHTKDYLRL